MKLFEYEGKMLYQKAGIPIPKSFLLKKSVDVAHIPKSWKQVMLKAQLLQGGRGKAGLVKRVTRDNAKASVAQMFKQSLKGERVKTILAEEVLGIKQEHYIAWMLDRDSCAFRLIYSACGGTDIEYLAKHNPKAIIQHVGPDESIAKKLPKKIRSIAKKLFHVLKANDATLAEINPLIETTRGSLIAADAKVSIDDNALFRHEEWLAEQQARQTPAERIAQKMDVHYVPLGGDVGVVGNGAGLIMATLDLLKQKGLKPADFLDVRGGASAEAMQRSLEIVWKLKPRALFINIFAGITHADLMAKGIIAFKREYKVNVPIVVRMIGTHESQAAVMLKQENITPVRSLEEGIAKLAKVLA